MNLPSWCWSKVFCWGLWGGIRWAYHTACDLSPSAEMSVLQLSSWNAGSDVHLINLFLQKWVFYIDYVVDRPATSGEWRSAGIQFPNETVVSDQGPAPNARVCFVCGHEPGSGTNTNIEHYYCNDFVWETCEGSPNKLVSQSTCIGFRNTHQVSFSDVPLSRLSFEFSTATRSTIVSHFKSHQSLALSFRGISALRIWIPKQILPNSTETRNLLLTIIVIDFISFLCSRVSPAFERILGLISYFLVEH